MARPHTTNPEICPLNVCDGSGFVVDEATNTATDCRCRAQRMSRARSRALSGVIPRKYRGISFDRPPVTEIARPVAAAVKRYVNRIDEQLDAGRGLWFSGSVGTGKTTLAMLVSRHAIEAGRSVAIYSLPRLLAQIRTTFDDDRSNSYIDLIDRLTKVDLLHIDDVGAEKTSPWVLEQLYAIVNARYEDERSIVITTNLERDALAEQINERTVSRLEEMCEVLPLWGADARQEAAARRALGA
jgi:DNA replication protein DnaC